MSNQLPVINLMGPTASGKTALACELYERGNFELISVDSALVYKDMDIGTAKPTREEQELYPHRLIDIITPLEVYSAAQFVEDACKLIDEMQKMDYVVDFHVMKVVSIERNYTDIKVQGESWTIQSTVVGYIQNEYGEEGRIKSSSIKECTLYCSDAQHKELTDAFKNYINMRQKGEIKSW